MRKSFTDATVVPFVDGIADIPSVSATYPYIVWCKTTKCRLHLSEFGVFYCRSIYNEQGGGENTMMPLLVSYTIWSIFCTFFLNFIFSINFSLWAPGDISLPIVGIISEYRAQCLPLFFWMPDAHELMIHGMNRGFLMKRHMLLIHVNDHHHSYIDRRGHVTIYHILEYY